MKKAAHKCDFFMLDITPCRPNCMHRDILQSVPRSLETLFQFALPRIPISFAILKREITEILG